MPRLLLLLTTSTLALTAMATEPTDPLREALRLHASFDRSLDADWARGGDTLRVFTNRQERRAGGKPAQLGVHADLAEGEGRFGSALYRGTGHEGRLIYSGPGNLALDETEFSGTASFWLRTSPDEDMPVAFCDPLMFISDNHRDGFLFVEWSKDHSPRRFRYAILPEYARWNPEDRAWESFPDDERPMVQLDHRPFNRDTWVHVVFTYDRIGAGQAGEGQLFIDGKLEGEIAGWDLTFAWNPEAVLIALAWNYAGFVDDLALFDRALRAAEVARLHALPGGVGDLWDDEDPGEVSR